LAESKFKFRNLKSVFYGNLLLFFCSFPFLHMETSRFSDDRYSITILSKSYAEDSIYKPAFFQFNNSSNIETTYLENWTKCHDHREGRMPFDLKERNADILNGRDAAEYNITYHYSEAEATSNSNPINSEVLLDGNTGMTIYYRLESKKDSSSFTVDSFTINVILTRMKMDELEFCGNSEGYIQLKLADLDDGMLNHQDPSNSQDPSNHSVAYYLTEADAENQVNPIDKNQWTNTVPDFQEIFVRVQRTDEYACFHIKFFHLYISRKLENPTASDETICLGDGSSGYNYDLNNKDAEILDTTDPAEFNILYFNSESEAINRSGEITQIHTSQLPQTIYFRAEDSFNQGCFNTGSFQLEVQNGAQAKEPAPFMLCDIDETGIYSLDLGEKDPEILDGLNPADYKVAYYSNQQDANNNINEIPKDNYEAGVGSESLIAKLSSPTSGCTSTVKLDILVSSLPHPELEESYSICPGNEGVILDGGNFESWEWIGTNYENIGNERTITINEPGDYGLSVTKTTEGITCQNTIFFTINRAGTIGEISYNLSGSENNRRVTIQTSNAGDYEYSLDGINYQTSNEFFVSPGNYSIYVQEINGCDRAPSEIYVPGYQEYFTPNGDGNNEKWEIEATEDGEFLDVLIYDRYGKFLVQIMSGKDAWDGTYNGKPMPSDDYWFCVEYKTGHIVTGHFSLVRS
jgi:gliding motility-associated-like protein